MKVKLSIIIVNWNTAKLLRQCLDSLKSEMFESHSKIPRQMRAIRNPKSETEIIVVDNGSTDGSAELVQSLKLKVIRNKENLGFAKANNQGIKEAQGEYIMLLNSDTIVEKGAIERMVDFLDSHNEVDIVGPRLLNTDGTPQANCGRFPNLSVVTVMLFKEHLGGSDYVRRSPKESGFVDWLMGAAFIAKKQVFDKIGGLDEKMFMYMEEVEWFYRAAKAGYRAYFLKEAEIVHLGRGSSKTGKTEPILNIYRGVIYFYTKHKSLPEQFLLRLLLKIKALMALFLGYLKNDNYLKETYGQAVKIN